MRLKVGVVGRTLLKLSLMNCKNRTFRNVVHCQLQNALINLSAFVADEGLFPNIQFIICFNNAPLTTPTFKPILN